MFVEEPGVAGMHPTVLGLGAGGRIGILVVSLENAGAAVEDFAVVVDLDFDVDRINLTVGLHADEHHALGLPVELLDVDAERAVEIENFRADGLAGGVGEAGSPQAQHVLQRAVDEQVAERIQQAVF